MVRLRSPGETRGVLRVNWEGGERVQGSPRLCFFFLTVVLKLAGSGIAAATFVVPSPPLAVGGIIIWLLWFAALFMIAMPETDTRLRRFLPGMKRSVKVACGIILAGGLAWLLFLMPVDPANNKNELLGEHTGALLTSAREMFGYNDATALSHQAADNFLAGKNPYAESNIVTASRDYGGGGIKVTPLRRGAFADSFPYPTLDELKPVFEEALKHPDVIPVELESKLNYPAGSFLLLAPFLAAGVEDVRIIFAVLLLAALAYTIWLARGRGRLVLVMALLVSLELYNLVAVGETGALQFPFLLLGWVLARKNWRTSAVMMGIAVSIKQVSWFYMLFYMVLVLRENDWRHALKVAGIAAAVFLGTNLPFIVQDPALWLSSLAAPFSEPMFPLGVGIVTTVTSGLLAIDNALVFNIMAIAVLAGGLVWYYRNCRRYPYTGLVLAVLPLFFSWRSLWTYFFFMDLMLLAAIVINEYRRNRPSLSIR